MFRPLIAGFIIAVIVFVIQTRLQPDRQTPPQPRTPADDRPPERWKALFPPLPVLLIFFIRVFFTFPPAPFERGLSVFHAIVISPAIALLVCREEISLMTRTFFEGMGCAFATIISFLATARWSIARLT